MLCLFVTGCSLDSPGLQAFAAIAGFFWDDPKAHHPPERSHLVGKATLLRSRATLHHCHEEDFLLLM